VARASLLNYAEIEAYARHSDPQANAAVIAAEGKRLRHRATERAWYPPWPTPGVWIGGGDEIGAQLAAMNHLAPIEGCRVLQIGGSGIHGLNMVAAGADLLMLVSPVLQELQWCQAVADVAGFGDRLEVVVAIAEELPLPADAFDIVYSPSTLHHTATGSSFPEIARILAPDGRFASVDVYRSVLYDLGIRLFGKRGPNVFCRPLDDARIAPFETLPNAALTWHGALFRYPLAVLARSQRTPPFRWLLRLAALEDALTRRVHRLRSLASLVSVTAGTSTRPDSA
jgi:SAM-dependent methyltransferase